MPFTILGLGTATPPGVVTQEESRAIAARLCARKPEHVDWLRHIYGHSGIETRHFCVGRDVIRDVLDGTALTGSPFVPTAELQQGPSTAQRMEVYRRESVPLAIAASRKALRESSVSADRITHLVTVSCTGFHAPGFDVAVVRELGLAPSTPRTHIGWMGCHGALNGLRVARAFADAEPNARVLMCAVELCSLHYHYGWDPQRNVANALFADGAAALVGGDESVATRLTVPANGCCLLPESEADMSWSVGDFGFEMSLSKRVPGLIAKHVRPWLSRWLADYQLTIEDVSSWAIHPGGPRILDAAAEGIGLSEHHLRPSRDVFARFGNMSSPTVLFIIDELRNRHAKRPIVALGFGPGLNAEAALIL
jgi:predicted naringenin-chalcone synthase